MTLLVDLVSTSERVAANPGRRAKIRELAAFLRAVPPDEIETAAHYLSGEIRQGRIGLGYASLQGARSAAAAETSLTLTGLDASLDTIEAIRGAGSAARRLEELRRLFASATAAEQTFLLRLLTGELRQGALAAVMVEAIAAAAELPTPQVRRAAMYAHSLGALARVSLLEGAQGLARFQLQLFSPVAPMLAQTATDVAEALEALGGGEVALEWKMDGARIQVHKRDDDIRVYTRSLNDVSSAVPEIVESARALSERTLVLDGEAIAFDAVDRPHPFQVTMRRFGRKLDVEQLLTQLPIRAFYFDCLYFNDRSIVDLPARERSQMLAMAVPSAQRIPRFVTASKTAAREFYDAALNAGHEGVMAKSLDAPYEAGNRGAGWLKIKRAHTLDLVVLAAEWGHGRRSGKLSNLHLGALDPVTGEYVMLGKTFKGLTDALLEWQTRELLAREVRRDEGTVYVRPELVVEIAFSDLQASKRYPGGLALRLARVKRYRNDKQPQDADNMESVRRIFAAQAGAE